MNAHSEIFPAALSGRPQFSLSKLAVIWRRFRLVNVLLTINLMFLIGAVVGLAVDSRTVLGAPVWAKTFKFAVSVQLYGLTLAWMLGKLVSRPRLSRFVAGATGVILLIEMAVLIVQAVRGQPMHFNETPGIDVLLWRVMTVLIFTLYTINLIGAVAVARERMTDPVMSAGIKLGLLITMLGLGLGNLMPIPNATQIAALTAGQQLTQFGAHNVNALVDGQTRMLPILGWNMDGGDLRIPHFVGMHAAQILPLLALLVSRISSLPTRRRVLLVWTGAFGYLGLIALVTWQALRDQSIVAPDGLTLLTGGGLIAVTALLAVLNIATARRASAG
jgi:hypothetical protein